MKVGKAPREALTCSAEPAELFSRVLLSDLLSNTCFFKQASPLCRRCSGKKSKRFSAPPPIWLSNSSLLSWGRTQPYKANLDTGDFWDFLTRTRLYIPVLVIHLAPRTAAFQSFSGESHKRIEEQIIGYACKNCAPDPRPCTVPPYPQTRLLERYSRVGVAALGRPYSMDATC
jgi:hypothetical protein